MQQALPLASPSVGESGTALLIERHRARRVRVCGREPGRAHRLRMSFLDGSGEPQRVLSPSELEPDSPLTPREEREYHRLDSLLAGQDRPPTAEYRRFEALRLRSLHGGEAAR